jgi:hypothetical protein
VALFSPAAKRVMHHTDTLPTNETIRYLTIYDKYIPTNGSIPTLKEQDHHALDEQTINIGAITSG